MPPLLLFLGAAMADLNGTATDPEPSATSSDEATSTMSSEEASVKENSAEEAAEQILGSDYALCSLEISAGMPVSNKCQ